MKIADLRRQALILSYLAVLLGPIWAQADSCRIFIGAGVTIDQAQIKKKGYEILPLKGNAQDVRDLFDIALTNGALHNVEVWMRVTPTYGGQVGVLPNGDAQYLPSCEARADLADVGYFRSNFGELARRRLDQFYLARKSSPGLGELLLKIEAERTYGSLKFKEKADEWTANWDILVSAVKNDWHNTEGFPIFDRLDRIRKSLTPNLGFSLQKGASNLSAALSENPGGDSFYQTQLMLAALIDAGVNAGPDRAFGIQLYHDYTRPVILESQTGKIYDLVSGTEQDPDAPIYSPELITFGIASAAGRAVDFERDFYLKLADMKMSSINVGLVAKTLLGIEKSEKDWRQLDSNFGPASSKVDTDTIRLGSYPLGTKLAVVKSSKHHHTSQGGGGGGLTDDDSSDNDQELGEAGAGMKHYYNPTKRSAEGSATTEEVAKELVPLFWGQIPESERPVESEQVLLARTAFWAYDEPSADGIKHLLKVLPHLRVAEPHELKLFSDDLDFAFVPAPVKKLFEVAEKGGEKFNVLYPGFETVFRDAEKLKQYTGGYYDPVDFPDDLRNALKGIVSRAMQGVNVAQMRQWLQHPELLIMADTNAVVQSLEKLILAEEIESQAKQTLWYTVEANEEVDQVLCDLAFTAAQTSIEYGHSAAQKLETLDKLDPLKRILFVKNVRAIHRLWMPLHSKISDCKKKAPNKAVKSVLDDALLNPLDVLLSHLVLSTLDSDRYEAKAQMRVMSDTTFFELLEGSKPGEKTPSTINTEAMVTEEMPAPIIAQSAPDSPAAHNAGKLPISSEAYFSLLMGASAPILHNPIVQVLTNVVWDESLTNHYQDFWRGSPEAEDRIFNLWNWAKFLGSPRLPGIIKRRVAIVQSSDGLYVKSTGLRFGDAKIPKHLMPLIRGILLSKGAAKVTWQSTPANPEVVEEQKRPEFYLNECLVTSNVSDGSVFVDESQLAVNDRLAMPIKFFNLYLEYSSRACPQFVGFEYFYAGEAPASVTDIPYRTFYSTKALGDKILVTDETVNVKKSLTED